MIVRFVKFKSALSESEVMRIFEERAPEYRKLAGLVQKYYFKDGRTGEFGAVYLWESMRAMEEFQRSELSRTIPRAYRIIGEPRVEVFDLVYTLRNEKG